MLWIILIRCSVSRDQHDMKFKVIFILLFLLHKYYIYYGRRFWLIKFILLITVQVLTEIEFLIKCSHFEGFLKKEKVVNITLFAQQHWMANFGILVSIHFCDYVTVAHWKLKNDCFRYILSLWFSLPRFRNHGDFFVSLSIAGLSQSVANECRKMKLSFVCLKMLHRRFVRWLLGKQIKSSTREK